GPRAADAVLTRLRRRKGQHLLEQRGDGPVAYECRARGVGIGGSRSAVAFPPSLDASVFSYGGSLFWRTPSGLCCFRYSISGQRTGSSLCGGGMAIDFAQWLHALPVRRAWCEPILANRRL